STPAIGRSKRALMKLKMVAFAPMPRARVRIATTEKLGFLRSIRAAYWRCWKNEGMVLVFGLGFLSLVLRALVFRLSSEISNLRSEIYSYLSATNGSTFVARRAGT